MALVLNQETNEAYMTLGAELRREIDALMANTAKQVNNSVEILASEISSYAINRVTIEQAELLTQIELLKKSGGGMFDNLVKALSDSVMDKTFTISEDIFFEDLQTEADFTNENDQLMWQAMLVNTCPSCLDLHGKIMSRNEWQVEGVPNQRNTLCTQRTGSGCNCVLLPADIMPSTEEMRKPITIQSKRIRQAEKKRGKSYADSTKTGFLGQINKHDGRISDLRKIKKVSK